MTRPLIDCLPGAILCRGRIFHFPTQRQALAMLPSYRRCCIGAVVIGLPS